LRNEVLKRQAKALEKHSAPAVLEIRKLEAEAKLSMAGAEKAAIKADGWAGVKIKGYETEMRRSEMDDAANQRTAFLRKSILEVYVANQTDQNLRALIALFASG